MYVFALDTNFVAPRILHGGKRKREINLLDRMLFLQSKDLIRISLHQATQAEIYAILRVGRMKVKTRNGKVKKKFPHHLIMRLVHRYKELFDVDFIDSLESLSFEDEESYKQVLLDEVKYHLKMDIRQSIEYIENRGVSLEDCNDPYDYHIIVTALQDSADFLVTANIDDFPNPLRTCKVITEKELLDVLPVYP